MASRLPATINVASIRHRLSIQFGGAPLSQAAFAKRFGLSAAAVADWEQGRRRPDAAARVLLLVIREHAHTVDAVIQAVID